MAKGRRSEQVYTYTDGNTVRKVKPARKPNTKRQKESREERIREDRERIRSHRAQQERLRRKSAGLGIVSLVILFLASVITLGMCASYLQLKNNIDIRIASIEKKKTDLEKLRSENDSIQNSIDTAIDLDRIFNTATKDLGMVYADEGQIITYDKTESEYVRQYEQIPRY